MTPLRWLALLATCVTTPLGADSLLVDNVRGYTLDDAGEVVHFSHLLVENGRVKALGTGIPPQVARQIDGGGSVLLPGMIDSHVGVLELGLRQIRVELSGLEGNAAVIARVRAFDARDQLREPWLVGYGWHDPGAPDVDVGALDAIDRPTVLVSDDRLSAWANAAALRAAGWTGVERGAVVTNARLEQLRSAVPAPEPEVVDRALGEALRVLASVGITTVHDVAVNGVTLAAYRQRRADGGLPIRVYGSLDGVAQLEGVAAPEIDPDDLLTIRSVRMPVDGSLAQREAALSVDYADDGGNRGMLVATEAEIARWTRAVRERGFQMSLEADGDAAVARALNGLARGGAEPAERHRIERALVVHVDDVEPFRRLGIVASLQPAQTAWQRALLEQRLPQVLLDRVLMIEALREAGVTVALGSGAPAVPAAPFRGWYAALSTPHAPSREAVFDGFTRAGARAMHLEGRVGALQPGAWADFILVDRDPLTGGLPELRNAVTLSTWVRGRRVWNLPGFDEDPLMPIAPNIELSLPAETPVVLEAPQPPAPFDSLAPAEVNVEPFRILGAVVPSMTSTRLAWSAGEYIEVISGTTPVLVVHGAGSGPVVCLTGAVHGDELNGIEVVRRVLYGLDPAELTGTVVGIPIVNVQGFRRASRYLVDRRDLNRFFPGQAGGSSASRIAYSLFEQVIKKCDALVDVHTGSFQRTNLPQLRVDLHQSTGVELAKAFGEMVVVHSVGAPGTLRRAAMEAGIAAVTLEIGGPMQLQEDAVKVGVRGVNRLLDNLEMYPRVRLWGNPQRIYRASTWVRAERAGVLLTRARLGTYVATGEVLATIVDPITNVSSDVVAPHDGRILGMAVDQIVMPGFATFRIGIESDEAVPLVDELDEEDVDYEH